VSYASGLVWAREEHYNLTLAVLWPPGLRILGQVTSDADGNPGLDKELSYVSHITGRGRVRGDPDIQ